MNKFYRILLDAQNNDVWFIHGPFDQNGNLVNSELFTTCRIYSDITSELSYRIDEGGAPTNFTYASFHVPVIDERICDVLLGCDSRDIQLIPVKIEDERETRHWILNVIRKVQCLDEQNSTIMWWKPEDGRPDKVGQYRMVSKIKLERNRIGNRHIFRLDGWEVALIISNQLKRKLELNGISGVLFEEME